MKSFLPTYLIGLREGLEATLVVTILVAFLVKSDQRRRLAHVWAGVGLAVALSVGFAALLEFTSANLTSEGKELFEGIASLGAVVFVTWMIFWMRRAARTISGELRTKLGHALELGSVAIIVTAFLAVAREGLETALFFFATVQGESSAWSVTAILLGIGTSILIGLGLYFSAVRINLTRFFTWTGALLVLVAAGILKYGVHDLQEANVLPGEGNVVSQISYDATVWWAELLRGMFNFTPTPSVLESLAWVAYAVPVLVLFLRPGKPLAPASPAQAASGSASRSANA